MLINFSPSRTADLVFWNAWSKLLKFSAFSEKSTANDNFSSYSNCETHLRAVCVMEYLTTACFLSPRSSIILAAELTSISVRRPPLQKSLSTSRTSTIYERLHYLIRFSTQWTYAIKIVAIPRSNYFSEWLEVGLKAHRHVEILLRAYKRWLTSQQTDLIRLEISIYEKTSDWQRT